MQDPVLAACEDCGKNYRVPSADRTYSCKACGGTVSVEAEASSAHHAAGRSRRRGHSGGSHSGGDHARGEHAERGERHRHKRHRNYWGPIVWVVMGGVFLAGVNWMMSGSSEAASRESEPDLGKVIAGFDVAWNAGDMDTLVTLLHPDKQLQIGDRLRTARQNRGWEEGHAPVIGETAPQAKSATDPSAVAKTDGLKAKTGISLHETKDGAVVCRWQFNPGDESWYIYQLELPSPDISKRLDAFEPAWNAGDEEALRPFLDPSKVDKLLFAFAKAADKRNRDEIYPQLTGREIDPSPADLKKLGFTQMYKRGAKVNYDTEYGTLMVRWKMLPQDDAWFVTSFDPPE